MSTSLDLSVSYLGLKLKNPVVVSASPLTESIDNYKKMEEAGAAAIVNFSLFEEQIKLEAEDLESHVFSTSNLHAEALSYFPKTSDYVLGPEEYLKHIAKAKKAVKIPVIGSLNGYTPGGWTQYAKYIQDAGADALELNLYSLATDINEGSEAVERRYVEVVKEVCANVSIPVAVKIGPYFSSTAHMAKRFSDAGAKGLVLFNRFYQPDIDLERLEIVPNVILSTPMAMRLPLRWIAILYGKLPCSLAGTSGIHSGQDAIKMLMAGADVTMLCSVLLRYGISKISDVLTELREWMEENEYRSVAQMQGSMSQKRCADPGAFERANYMKSLSTYGRPLPE